MTLSNTTWVGGGRYFWDINGTNGPAGVDWDSVAINNLSHAGTNATRFVIDLVDLSWTNALGLLDPSETNSFLIARAAEGSFGQSDWFSVVNNVAVSNYGWWVSIGNDNKDLLLNYGYGNFQPGGMLVIPEPNVLLLWLSRIATAYAARRRMKGKK